VRVAYVCVYATEGRSGKCVIVGMKLQMLVDWHDTGLDQILCTVEVGELGSLSSCVGCFIICFVVMRLNVNAEGSGGVS